MKHFNRDTFGIGGGEITTELHENESGVTFLIDLGDAADGMEIDLTGPNSDELKAFQRLVEAMKRAENAAMDYRNVKGGWSRPAPTPVIDDRMPDLPAPCRSADVGQSIYAHLAYGIDLGSQENDYEYYDTIPVGWARLDEDAEELCDDVDPDEVGIGSWEEELARLEGLAEQPWVDEDEDPDGYRKWDTWIEAKRVLVDSCPVKIEGYNTSEYRSWFVCVRSSLIEARFEAVPVPTIVTDPVWEGQIRTFMERMRLPMPEGKQIGWWIFPELL